MRATRGRATWGVVAAGLALCIAAGGCGTVRLDGDDEDGFSFSLFGSPAYDVFHDDGGYVEYVDYPADVYVEDVYYEDVVYEDVYYDDGFWWDFWGDGFYFDYYDGWYDDGWFY